MQFLGKLESAKEKIPDSEDADLQKALKLSMIDKIKKRAEENAMKEMMQVHEPDED